MAGKQATGRTRQATPAGKGCLAVVVVVIVVVLGSWAWSTLTSGPSASYRATVTSYTEVNPATLSVAVRVTNTGRGAGTPSCQINASDPSGTYTGVDLVTLKGSLAPGATANFADPAISITGQGAKYITQVTVSCS